MNGPFKEEYWKAALKEIETLEAMDALEVVELQTPFLHRFYLLFQELSIGAGPTFARQNPTKICFRTGNRIY